MPKQHPPHPRGVRNCPACAGAALPRGIHRCDSGGVDVTTPTEQAPQPPRGNFVYAHSPAMAPTKPIRVRLEADELAELIDISRTLTQAQAALTRRVDAIDQALRGDTDTPTVEDQVEAEIHCTGCLCPAKPDTQAVLNMWAKQEHNDELVEHLRQLGLPSAAAVVAELRPTRP